MIENVEVLYHSSIRIKGNKTIYIDPFKINENSNSNTIIIIFFYHFLIREIR